MIAVLTDDRRERRTSRSPRPTARPGAGTPAPAPQPVELDHVTRSFGDVRALDDLCLTVAPGELLALLGPSGCGKTTALRALAGLEDIDAGSIRVGGREVAGVPAHRRDMAMVFQAYSLMPHMTVAQNVAFALELRGVTRGARGRTVDHHLELVGLGAHRDRYAHQLSGGQQQRVALARALAVQPSVLLLDEPLSALDAKVRVQLREEIRRIQTEVGITTVFVTHDQEEALAVADTVAIMAHGKVAQLGAPQDVYERPASAFVAEFVGTTNRLPARAAGETAVVPGVGVVTLLPGSERGDVDVLVRPEDVRLLLPDEAPVGGADARVVAVSYLGSHARVQARMASGALVTSQLRVDEASVLTVGAAVQVRIGGAPALAVLPRA